MESPYPPSSPRFGLLHRFPTVFEECNIGGLPRPLMDIVILTPRVKGWIVTGWGSGWLDTIASSRK